MLLQDTDYLKFNETASKTESQNLNRMLTDMMTTGDKVQSMTELEYYKTKNKGNWEQMQ